MSRTISTPLTAEDLAYLRERVSEEQVARLVELHGVEDGTEEAGDGPEDPAQGDGSENADEGGDGSEKDDDGTGNGDDDDLIGGGPTFDPADSTEDEIRAYLEGNPEDKERVLALEAEGRQRKGVLAL